MKTKIGEGVRAGHLVRSGVLKKPPETEKGRGIRGSIAGGVWGGNGRALAGFRGIR